MEDAAELAGFVSGEEKYSTGRRCTLNIQLNLGESRRVVVLEATPVYGLLGWTKPCNVFDKWLPALGFPPLTLDAERPPLRFTLPLGLWQRSAAAQRRSRFHGANDLRWRRFTSPLGTSLQEPAPEKPMPPVPCVPATVVPPSCT